jgi:cation diffusion facilitator CzcD-associated flavoprotein CzcO
MADSKLPTAAVIGAGSSGIAAAKKLQDAGIEFDVFEKSDRVGGNWVFGNRNGMSSAYRSLHINTSRDRMTYADYPMPADYPDFPHHSQIAQYFQDYVEHFDLRPRIRFETGVEHASRRRDGVWELSTERGETLRYDALLVANGHHWDPRWPEPAFPGSDSFEGVQMHAHHYVDNQDLRGKNVVVLGMGNSAMDIAVEAAQVASNVYLAARRGVHVIPKYLWGRPLDQMGLSPRIPFPIRQKILTLIIRSTTGPVERYGLPRPDHKIAHAHPTISDEILSRLTHGAITPKPNIAALEGHSVRFVDGTAVEADVVVYATGYKVTFPFFDPGFIAAPNNDLPLYRRVFHPDIPNVFFVALLQPLGATMPLAEAQGEWIGAYLRGEYALPPARAMRRDMERERRKMFKRYVASPRHTMQVDFDDYLLWLSRERERGRERARARGFAPPVAPRAASLQADGAAAA